MTVVRLHPNPPYGYEYLDGTMVPALEAANRRGVPVARTPETRPRPDPARVAEGLAAAQAQFELAGLRRKLRHARWIAAAAVAAAALSWLAPARAATPTETAAIQGRIEVQRQGACGSGGVVVGDGCATRPADGLGFGQGMEGGTNSQDIADLKGWIVFDRPVNAVWFTVQDAHDQIYTRTFKVAIGGHRYEIARRQANGAQTTFLVRLGRATQRVSLRLLNLGWGDGPVSNDGHSSRASGACW